MADPPYVELLRALQEARIRYAVVGGLAVVLHGVPRMTFDLDLAVDPADDNMLALVGVLAHGGYCPRVPEPLEKLADPAARASWRAERNMLAFNVRHPLRNLEDVDMLLLEPHEWSVLAESVAMRRLAGVEVPILGRRALIVMKRASGRPQDLADADALELIDDA